MGSSLAASREFFERALSEAEARGDRIETRLIALRVCEVIEQEDFGEYHRLSVRPIVSYEGAAVAAD